MSKQICIRCVCDDTFPAINFDDKGVCAYCRLQDILDKEYPTGLEGERRLQVIVERMKAHGKDKKFDCVTGISGGRDSTYTLWLLKKKYGLNPLAVHFNDGFGNPTAGENMQKACRTLGVEKRTITSDWRESKDLKIAFLKASVPELEQGTDLGIASALYGVAAKEDIKYVVIGQSFRTEGIAPLEWNFLDGRYLKKVHQMYGQVALRKWSPSDPGFNLSTSHMAYYLVWKGIRTVTPLYNLDYARNEAEEIIVSQLGWENTGAHYYDDLYQSLMTYILRVKFNIDRRKLNYAALVRAGQMTRDEALERISEVSIIEDPKVINLCIKRLGLSREEFEEFMVLPLKTFRDYPTSFTFIRALKLPIWTLTKLGILPKSAYDKYFHCI